MTIEVVDRIGAWAVGIIILCAVIKLVWSAINE